jgi:integrase/recombinase XerD
MLFSEAIKGFFMYAETGVYSPAYIPTMRIQLNYMCKYFEDPEVTSLTPEHWEKYLHHLHTEYKPVRFGGDDSPLALSTIDNHWKTIRAFYNWAAKKLEIDRPDLDLPRTKYATPEIVPFSQDEVIKLLNACQYTQVEKQSGKKYRIKRPNADRDRAVILMFLDTGVRLGEFNRVVFGDVDLESGGIFIRPFRSGIKSMPRTVFLGRRAKEALWKYIAKLSFQPRPNDRLFDLKASSIRLLINRIGYNAKVHAHPHRFRHTFAVNYLLNGGDVFTLQRLMGHKTLEMTMRYVHFVKSDLANVHRIASPVDNWKL